MPNSSNTGKSSPHQSSPALTGDSKASAAQTSSENAGTKFIRGLSESLSRNIVKNSESFKCSTILPPSLSLSRKRAATSNLRHYFAYKKPRVSQQLGQAIKSIIRRKIISANLSGNGGKPRARSDSFENLDGTVLDEVEHDEKDLDANPTGPTIKAADTKAQNEVKVKNELYTEEDLIKANLEIETLAKSIVELKAKKKEQFLQLKTMLTAERKRQKRAAEEAAERHKQLALAAASAAESLQVEKAPMRAMMTNNSGNSVSRNIIEKTGN